MTICILFAKKGQETRSRGSKSLIEYFIGFLDLSHTIRDCSLLNYRNAKYEKGDVHYAKPRIESFLNDSKGDSTHLLLAHRIQSLKQVEREYSMIPVTKSICIHNLPHFICCTSKNDLIRCITGFTCVYSVSSLFTQSTHFEETMELRTYYRDILTNKSDRA